MIKKVLKKAPKNAQEQAALAKDAAQETAARAGPRERCSAPSTLHLSESAQCTPPGAQSLFAFKRIPLTEPHDLPLIVSLAPTATSPPEPESSSQEGCGADCASPTFNYG